MDWGVMEKVLAALIAIAIVIFFLPSTSRAIKQGRKAEKGEWQSLVMPLLLVVLFVIFLISLV